MDGVLEMLKGIMKELGQLVQLHIFPGSFNLPVQYQQSEAENIDILADIVSPFCVTEFSMMKRISLSTIHLPRRIREDSSHIQILDWISHRQDQIMSNHVKETANF